MGKGTAAWLSPAVMYSVVPAGTKVSEFALGRWEGCNLLHGICLSRARLSTSACHKVVTGSACGAFHRTPMSSRHNSDVGNGDVMSLCHNLEPSLVARDSFSTPQRKT